MPPDVHRDAQAGGCRISGDPAGDVFLEIGIRASACNRAKRDRACREKKGKRARSGYHLSWIDTLHPAERSTALAELPVTRARRDRFDRFLAVPLIGPVLLLLAGNADFMFDPPGWIDAFGMVGRFWHYADQNPLFEEYKGSRLPWILPGFVLHHLFDEVTASYILHTIVLIGSSVGVYLLLRDTLHDRPVAGVTAAAWSSYTWIHGNGGWNYHTAAAAAYYVWGLWMLARSTSAPRPRLWLAGSGAMLVSAVQTHIVFAGFLPIAALLYIPLLERGRREGWRDGAVAAGYVAAGAVGATMLLGAIDVASGGSWLFFLPQIEYTLYFVETGNRWLRGTSAWIPTARYMVIPCIALAGAFPWLASAWLKRRNTTAESRFACVLVVQGVLAFGLMAYLQFVAGQTVLDYPYVTVPLYCHVFPMLGAFLWSSRRDGTRADLLFTLAMALVIAAPLLLLLPSWLPQHMRAFTHAVRIPDSSVVLAPFLVGAAALPLGLLRGRSRIAAFSIVYGLLNAWLAAAPNAYGIGTAGVNRDMLVAFRSLEQYTTELDPSLFAIRYWGEPGMVEGVSGPIDMADVFRSFLAIRRRSLITVAYDRPDTRVDQLTQADLYSSNCIGVLSTAAGHQDVVDRITNRFSEIGVRLRPVGHHRADSGPFSIALTVLTTRPADDPRPGLLPCPPMP